MPSRLLIDVDAFVKLAHWCLLDEVAALTGVAVSQWSTTSSLKYRAECARARPDGKLFHCVAAVGIATSALQQMEQPPAVDHRVLALLSDVPAIDPGEALLLSALVADREAWLMTGDKRSVVAVSGISGLASQIQGRVISVEQILLRALEAHSLAWLRKRICPWRHLDKAVASIMGSHCTADELSVRQGLMSYIDSERSACRAPLLVARLPPC